MHYGRYYFSKNSQPTLQKIGCPDCELGQRDGLSESDAEGLNIMYCDEQVTGKLIDRYIDR